VRDKAEAVSQFESLPSPWKAIDVLINNAGNAHGLDPTQTANTDDWDAMIDINVKGLLYVSRAIIPGMVARKKGHIINIGSIAAKQVYANGSVYCASKAAVDSITEGMRIDLNPYEIKVTSIHPGMVETEFSLVRFKGDKARASTVYKGLTPLSGNDIADTILYILHCPPHVVIADLVILPLAQASATVVKRV
jgi:3-hydroxy acid dehydrogenase / malonic semialdehyde reductase